MEGISLSVLQSSGGDLNKIGLNEEEIATWSSDGLADQVARYADPYISFTMETKEYDGKRFILIEIREFEDIPVLCKRAYDDVLRDGACYVWDEQETGDNGTPYSN